MADKILRAKISVLRGIERKASTPFTDISKSD
jgi:hypothetical protein